MIAITPCEAPPVANAQPGPWWRYEVANRSRIGGWFAHELLRGVAQNLRRHAVISAAPHGGSDDDADDIALIVDDGAAADARAVASMSLRRQRLSARHGRARPGSSSWYVQHATWGWAVLAFILWPLIPMAWGALRGGSRPAHPPYPSLYERTLSTLTFAHNYENFGIRPGEDG